LLWKISVKMNTLTQKKVLSHPRRIFKELESSLERETKEIYNHLCNKNKENNLDLVNTPVIISCVLLMQHLN